MLELDELLTKEITRRQFLAAVGAAVFSLVGFSSIMGLLTKAKSSNQSNNSGGFGIGGFGT
jgi:hypothetical protein